MRKFIASLIVCSVLFLSSLNVIAEGAIAKTVFNTSSITTGIIKISQTSENDKKLKVLIQKDGKTVSYNLKKDGTLEGFSLQMGNGTYKVSVLENIEADKYKYLSTQNVNLNIADQTDVFLGSIQNINWNTNMSAIKKAAELTKGMTDIESKINAIYNYLVANVQYDFVKLTNLQPTYLPSIDSTLATGKGICYDYASTFAAMLRSVGIPTKLVKGYSENVTGYHAWNEVYNEKTGKWITVDTTYDSQMKTGNIKYSMEKDTAKYTTVYEY